MNNAFTNGVATRVGKKFSRGSVDFLVSKAGKMSARSIAQVLHRTELSVRRKAQKLGVSLKVAR